MPGTHHPTDRSVRRRRGRAARASRRAGSRPPSSNRPPRPGGACASLNLRRNQADIRRAPRCPLRGIDRAAFSCPRSILPDAGTTGRPSSSSSASRVVMTTQYHASPRLVHDTRWCDARRACRRLPDISTATASRSANDFIVRRDFSSRWSTTGCRFNAGAGCSRSACGVGAQTEILLRHFPELHVTGIEINDDQIAEARRLSRHGAVGDRSLHDHEG